MTRARISAADLTRWEENGATWRIFDTTPDGVQIELCTCYGEPVDVVDAAPELVGRLKSGELTPASDPGPAQA
jgi:hypothetical protein